MLNISAMPGYIPLGNQRDFGHTIQFDLTAWADLNAGDWKITYTRPGESVTYPVSDGDVSVADNILTWTISEAVTAINGSGSVVIEAYRGGEMLKHSARIMTIIGDGHEPAGEAPDPVADWIDDANVKIGELDESLVSANAAEGLRLSAETARETAEGLRNSAETARKEAEVLRIAAEAARMGFKPMGAYSPANENKYGEWYTHEGSSYGYIYPTPSTGVPLTDTTHWQQIASVGGQDILDAVTAEKNAAIAAKVLAQGYAAQLAAGTASPVGTYADLAALIVADPDHSKIYVTDNDGAWCYHNGTTYVAGGVYQAAVLTDKKVTRKKTDFFVTGKNLFDKTAVLTGKYLNYNTGALSDAAGYNVSDYMYVSASTEYSTSVIGVDLNYYDIMKNRISGARTAAANFTTPANTAYIRIVVLDNKLDTFQLELGGTPTAYEPFAFKISKEDVEPELVDGAVMREHLNSDVSAAAYGCKFDSIGLSGSGTPKRVLTQIVFDTDSVSGSLSGGEALEFAVDFYTNDANVDTSSWISVEIYRTNSPTDFTGGAVTSDSYPLVYPIKGKNVSYEYHSIGTYNASYRYVHAIISIPLVDETVQTKGILTNPILKIDGLFPQIIGEPALVSPYYQSKISALGNMYFDDKLVSQSRFEDYAKYKVNNKPVRLDNWLGKPGRKISIIGDSTSDENVAATANIYSQLRDYHMGSGDLLENVSTIINRGSNGIDSFEYVSIGAINTAIADQADLYVICLGINDVRLAEYTQQDVTDNLIYMVERILDETDAFIIMRTPNPFLLTATNIELLSPAEEASIQMYTDMLWEIYESFRGKYSRVEVLDMQTRVFGRTCTADNPLLLDILHPNAEGCKSIGDEIALFAGKPSSIQPWRVRQAIAANASAPYLEYPKMLENGRYTLITQGYFVALTSTYLDFESFGNEYTKIQAGDIVKIGDFRSFVVSGTVTLSGTNIRITQAFAYTTHDKGMVKVYRA